MYSNYQRTKAGLLSRHYNKVDVKIEQQKLNKILSKYETYNKYLRLKADKHIKLLKSNIEFLCRMLNQQIIESA